VPVIVVGIIGKADADRPTREWQLRELVAKLPERQRKMAEGVFEGITWAQSCGALGDARRKARFALDEAWARLVGARR
jgi:hypothetical protein